MNSFETPAELRAAFDALLDSTQRQLRLYDHDLSLLDIDQLPRHNCLRAICVSGGGRRIELLLDEIHLVARNCPRLMQLVRDFGHVIEIRQADPNMPRRSGFRTGRSSRYPGAGRQVRTPGHTPSG